MKKAELDNIFSEYGIGTSPIELSYATDVTDPDVVPMLDQTGCPGIEFCENNISVGGLNVAKRGLGSPVPSNCLPCVERQENSNAA